MCHILLHDPLFFKLLLRIDIDLAQQMHAQKCSCGGALHLANYPRKPRGCPREVWDDYASRFSFCCSLCRKRSTPMSVRFLGRRVYLSLAVALMSMRHTGSSARQNQLAATLAIPARTLQRWRTWWSDAFPMTSLWQSQCARFMPPVEMAELPTSLLARFIGSVVESATRLLVFLMPLSVAQKSR